LLHFRSCAEPAMCGSLSPWKTNCVLLTTSGAWASI
jgi:hypothetical protein